MKEQLIKKSAEWFHDRDAWNAFIELAPLAQDIQEHWLNSGTQALRQHFIANPSPGWKFCAWDGYARDTWWFLEEFGPDSIGIGYGWRYHLCFGLKSGNPASSDALANLLRQDDFNPIITAFGRHAPSSFDFPLHQYGDFQMGSPNDGNLPAHEIAWFAGHDTESFVKQAAAKIEAITRNPEITDLVRQLNQELLKS